jgi:predicted aconitase with swiveling domain
MLLELLRRDLAPAAIINVRPEPLPATGPVLGKHFYGKTFPIVTGREKDFDRLGSGMDAAVVSTPDDSWVRITDPSR